MRYAILSLLTLACVGCDMGITPMQAPTQAQECTYARTDSTWAETCMRGDTTAMYVMYREGYYEQRGSDKKGIDLLVIVGNDTTRTEIE